MTHMEKRERASRLRLAFVVTVGLPIAMIYAALLMSAVRSAGL